MNPSEAIEHLRKAGMTEEVIGAAVGARQSTINRIRRGDMTPNYDLGKALVDMAVVAMTTGKKQELKTAA